MSRPTSRDDTHRESETAPLNDTRVAKGLAPDTQTVKSERAEREASELGLAKDQAQAFGRVKVNGEAGRSPQAQHKPDATDTKGDISVGG